MNPKIGIVIVNYNGINYQNDCIRTIYAMKYTNFKIIVVDSDSKDNSIDILMKEFPNVHVLKQTENVGVAKGNNIGIKYSIKLGMDYTLLLNNDVELDENLLSELVKKADKNTITVPKIYYYEPSDKLWYAGGYLDWKKADAKHFGLGEVDSGQYNEEKIVSYSPTCCMLIHNEIFEKTGFMDETYFMYFDDTDFCARVKEKNINLLYVPSSRLWHKVSSSTGGSTSKIATYYHNRNKLYFMKKFRTKIWKAVLCKEWIRGFLKYPVSFLYKKYNRIVFEAYKDYLTDNMGRK